MGSNPASDSPKDEKVAEFVRANLRIMRLDRITDRMLYAIHYGYAVGEIIWAYSDKLKAVVVDTIKVRDRSRFRFGTNGELYLLKPGVKAELMPAKKFWVFDVGSDNDDNPYGEGLAAALYWPVFFKRNGIKFWMIYLEKFGMPTAAAKLSQAQMNDPHQVSLALSVLDAIQADSGVVIPEDFMVELLEASRSGTADYNMLRQAMDASIAKIILSQTMTTDNGSSQSQATVHKGVKDEVVKSDADLICQSFNEQVIKQLIDINYPGAEYPTVWRKTEPEADLVQLAERDTKIMSLGFEPTEEYVADTYGPGWRKKAAEPALPLDPVAQMGPEFAEVSPLTEKRVNHRRDQQSLVDAAAYLATQYQAVYGKRVDQLLAYLEDSSDPEQFKQHLFEMMAEPAPESMTSAVTNASWTARLMGMVKGKR
uniref:phage portal protein family protein n=1 Tax=Salinimonas marina TaxID=2785918 RepID=UPI001E3399EF|nr:DUF935 family protein [Salinimonas marina]